MFVSRWTTCGSRPVCSRRRFKLSRRTDVDMRATEGRNMARQCGPNLLDDAVGLFDGESRIDGDVEIGIHTMPKPPGPHLVYIDYSSDMKRRMLDLVENLRLDSVEQSPEYRCPCILYDEQDCHRDQQADDRIEDWYPDGDPGNTDKYRQTGEAIHPCVLSVRDQGSGPNFPSDPHPELRNDLIAQKANYVGYGDPPDVCGLMSCMIDS